MANGLSGTPPAVPRSRRGAPRRTSQEPARLAVFISGGGRTLMNLQDAIDLGDLRATIALVVASRPCRGVERARARGLNVVINPPGGDSNHVADLLELHRVSWIVLAGYLHLFPIPPAYRGRVVNIHPALLPEFGGPGMYGHRVHEAVLRAGRRTSGCTVHMCDEVYDHGDIVLQLTCPVLPGDTPDTLADRVFVQECKAYPLALQTLIDRESRQRQGPPG